MCAGVGGGQDWKVSAVFSWDPACVDIHMAPLHDRAPSDTVTVLLAEYEREHATAKDTKWCVFLPVREQVRLSVIARASSQDERP